MAVLDDGAFGAATDVVPKFVSPADPAARWTGAHGGQAFFAYSTNYLIDVDNAIIVDVEATTAIRQAEVLAAKRMIERSLDRFDLYPARLLGDSAYGSAEMLGWLVYEHGIEPHVTVFDKSTRQDGTFSRDDFTYDHVGDVYSCPAGKMLTTTGSRVNDGATLRYRATHYPGAASGRITSLISSRRSSLPRKGCRVGLRIVLFEACSAFTRVAACTLALPPIRDTLIEGFSHFVTSMTAPIASGWSGCRVGLAPTGKRRLVTAHTQIGHSQFAAKGRRPWLLESSGSNTAQ